jgi:hypothetical protein
MISPSCPVKRANTTAHSAIAPAKFVEKETCLTGTLRRSVTLSTAHDLKTPKFAS